MHNGDQINADNSRRKSAGASLLMFFKIRAKNLPLDILGIASSNCNYSPMIFWGAIIYWPGHFARFGECPKIVMSHSRDQRASTVSI